MKNKLISLVTLISLLFSVGAMTALNVSGIDLVPYYGWSRREPLTDQDFTLAFVGDIQTLTYYNDYKKGTSYVDTLFSWIADNAEEQKIRHVFTLGDLTDKSGAHDPELSYGASDPVANGATYDAEYEIVKSAITKLDGIVPYSIVRGNHDGYHIDRFFNYEAYTENFDGFYREDSGVYKDSITNSYRLCEIEGIKFIFITLDFNPSREAIAWMDELLTTYSDHNAIITMHSFLTIRDNGPDIANILDIQGSIVQGKYRGAAPDWIWKNCLTKHENVIMTVSGHVGANVPQTLTTVGDNGNKVLNILVDPQFYDLEITPTGAVFLMHFYDGGKTVKTEYYSTIQDAYKNDGNYTWSLELIASEPAVTEAETTVAETTAASVATETSAETVSAENGCRSSISLVSIALIPAFTALSVVSVRKKKDY